MAPTARSHRRPRAVLSRRRATAIGVPSAMVALIGVAFAAAPAIAANNTALPFPTVCSSGQSGSGSASSTASASSSATPSTTATGTPTPSATTSPSGTATTTAKVQSPQTSASASGTATSSASGGSTASPSPSTSASGDGVWGWLNGVWTLIFSDAQYVGHSGAVAAAAPLAGGAHFEDAADTTGSSSSSSDSGSGSDSTATSDSNCLSSASAAALKAKADANGTSEGVYALTTPWVMKTPSMLMYDLTYNGVKTVKVLNPSTGKYEDEQVLDFTASKLTITSMVTYSIQNGQTVYNNAGSGTTTTLIDPHLMVVSMTAQLLGLIPQTYTPTNQPPLPPGLTVPLIPVLFTDVTTQLAFLNTGTISVPGFDGFAEDGVASPQ